jgi:hypothetical protein
LKNIELTTSLSYNNYYLTYDNGTYYIAIDFCYTIGLLKTVCVSKNNKWNIFYGAEALFLYNETITTKYNDYASIPGINLTIGLQYNLTKHISFSSQITPALGYIYFNDFKKYEQTGLGIQREKNTGHLKNFDLFFLRFLGLEMNYSFN